MINVSANFASAFPEKPATLDTQVFSLMASKGVDRSHLFASELGGSFIRYMRMRAMPCPVRLWTTLSGLPFGENTYVRSAAWNQIPSGLYAVPTGGITQFNPSVVVNGTRDITAKLTSGFAFRVALNGPFTTGGTITVTVGGANGYTVTRTIPKYASGWAEVFFTPAPYDDGDYRAIDITWTGGGTNHSSVVEYYQTFAIVPATLPDGWTATPAQSGGNQQDASRGLSFGPAFASIREWWRASNLRNTRYYYNGGASVFTPDKTIGVLNNHGPSEALEEPSELFTTGWGYNRFLSFISRPFWDGTQFRRAGHRAGPWRGASFMTYNGADIVRAPRVTGVKLFGEKSTPETQMVYVEQGVPDANGNWTPYGSCPSLYAGTWSHTGSGWEAFDVPLSYPVDADGAGWSAKLWLRLTGSYSFDNGPYYVAFYDPLPLPYTLPASDNVVIPGGYHADSSAVAKGAKITEKVYPTFAVADIPAGQNPWAVRMTDVPEGYYVLRAAMTSGGDVTAPLWGEHETAPASGIDTLHGMICTSGRMHWAVNLSATPGVSTFDNTYSSSGVRWTAMSITALTIAHKTFSLGANTIVASATDMGITFPYATPSQEFHFAFAQFTAPAAGVYRITHNRGRRVVPGIDAPAMWISTTDQLCSHEVPDLCDTVRSFRAAGADLGVINAPSAPSGSPVVRRGIIVAGTGAWAGLDGSVVWGLDPGDGGGVVSWRITNPPDGSFAYVSNTTAYIKVEGKWVLESTQPLSIDVPLGAGETLYMRLGRIERPSLTWHGSGYQTVGPALTITIEAL